MISDSRLAEAFWKHGRCEDCPVIDMHAHMGPYGGIYFPRASTERMIHTMDQCGVRMLAFCHHAALGPPGRGEALNVEAVRKYPDRLRAYVGVNPHYPEAIEHNLGNFDRLRDVYVGFKLHGSWHGTPWDAPAYEPVWNFANDRALLVLGHTWGGSTYDGPDIVRKTAEKYPNVRLLLGHSLHGAWDEAIAIAKKFPNVYLELTAVLAYRGPIEKFVAAGLSARLLFGTDLPWFDPHQGIGAVLSAQIADEDRHNILHRNAEGLLASVGVNV